MILCVYMYAQVEWVSPERRQEQHWRQPGCGPLWPASCSVRWTASWTPVGMEKHVQCEICLRGGEEEKSQLTSRMVQSARMALARYSSSFPVISLVRLKEENTAQSQVVTALGSCKHEHNTIYLLVTMMTSSAIVAISLMAR